LWLHGRHFDPAELNKPFDVAPFADLTVRYGIQVAVGFEEAAHKAIQGRFGQLSKVRKE
jgi:hypothetical protein